jgi:hypothetical protein
MVRGGRAEAPGPRSDVSFRLGQKTANFKADIGSRTMQWSATTEERQKESTCANRVSLHKSNNNNKRGAITMCPSPSHQNQLTDDNK